MGYERETGVMPLIYLYSCKCPPAFHGPECQQTQHTFRGHGYAWFPPIKPCFESRISLDFITEMPVGLLLYNGPVAHVKPGEVEDFIALGEIFTLLFPIWVGDPKALLLGSILL